MKTSNKILLGGFLFLILFITGIHVALYAKYKSGHYTIYKEGGDDGSIPMRSFPNLSIVAIYNSKAVIEFGDTLAVNDEKGSARFIQQDDSLVITSLNEGSLSGSNDRVRLVLPYNATIVAVNSDLSFEKGKEKAGIDPTVFLNNSIAVFAFSGKAIRLGHVKVNASDRSIAVFRNYADVSNLEVELKNSSLEYNEGDIGQLSIATDSTSQLTLQSKHLLKAKITPVPNNP